MKFVLAGLLLTFAATSYAQVPLREAVGHTLMVVKDINVPQQVTGVHFQSGQPITDTNKIDYSGGPLCFLAKYSPWDYQEKNKAPSAVKAGTVFVLTKAWENTTQINIFGNITKAITGYTFSTNSPAVYSLSADPVANWMDAPAKVIKDPSLLDLKIISQCFGDYVAVSQ